MGSRLFGIASNRIDDASNGEKLVHLQHREGESRKKKQGTL